MKKNIAIIILSVLLVFLLFYSFAQRTIAARAMQEAVIQRTMAEEQRQEAELQRRAAEANAVIARMAEDSANIARARAEAVAEQAREALERCK